jgi:integrase
MGRGRRGAMIELRYIHRYTDRHGHIRHYFRGPGQKKVTLPGKPGSPEFMAAYNMAIAAPRRPVGEGRSKAGTIAHWISLYLASAAFAALAPDTRRTRKNMLERFRVKHGEKAAATLEQHHIERMIGALSPVVARNFLKALRPWLKWCATQGLRSDNPARDVEKPAYKSEGYKTWPEEYVERYRAHHPIGSKPRLALELLVNTGAARADVVRLGKQHIRDGVLSFRRHKTGVLVEIPVLAGLQTILGEMVPTNQLTFLLTDYGQPFSDAGFGNWFRERCNEAGVPVGYSAHGIRKYAATEHANLGATSHELMAWFGWLTIREAERYTRNAERRRLAIGMGQRLGS